MAKKSNISILNPIVRKHIRKEEKIIKRKLSREERHEFIKNDKKQIKKDFRRVALKSSVVGVLVAIGIIGTRAMLPEPKEDNVKVEQQYKTDNSKSKEEKFRKELQTETPVIQPKTEEKEESILKEIANKCNLAEENIGIIKSCPRFLGIDKQGNYSFDYYEKTEIVDSVRENDIGDLYTIVDKENKQIISSIGEANCDIVNVNVKQIKVGQTEYTNSGKPVDLTVDENKSPKSEEEKNEIYKNIREAYQNIIEKNNDEMEIE